MKLLSLAWNAATGYRRTIASVVVLAVAAALLEAVTLLIVFSFVSSILAIKAKNSVSSCSVDEKSQGLKDSTSRSS